MSKMFLNAIKALLPSGDAFRITQNTTMRKLFEAIAVLPDTLRDEMENVYFDFFPETTRSPEVWEKNFLVLFSKDELEQRRRVLSTLWAMNSRGQGLYYLEKLLQNLYPRLKVFPNNPVANPRSSNVVIMFCCGRKNAVCGNKTAVCGYRNGSEKFEPIVLKNDTGEPYSIPNDSRFWQMCFFVADDVVRNSRGQILFVEPIKNVPIVYKNYIEYLILRLKEVQATALLEIQWDDGTNTSAVI